MATVVSLHAHPDDEALLTGGWLSQRSAGGDRVVLVFATDGGAGLASDRAGLGSRRRAEGEASARALGVHRVVWLGYDDGALAAVPLPDAARRVADVLDEEDAHVLTGYDARGGYGHPDHVQVHRIARAARDRAARRPRLLEATVDRTWLVRLFRVLRPLQRLLPGMSIPGDDEVYSAPEDINLRVDVRDHLEAKRAAFAAHASQGTGGIRTLSVLRALPNALARRVLGTEWFVEVP
jgi:LmbE family N-acetylglucosaminyl deacetylase